MGGRQHGCIHAGGASAWRVDRASDSGSILFLGSPLRDSGFSEPPELFSRGNYHRCDLTTGAHR